MQISLAAGLRDKSRELTDFGLEQLRDAAMLHTGVVL
jgi:hypothetical protein